MTPSTKFALLFTALAALGGAGTLTIAADEAMAVDSDDAVSMAADDAGSTAPGAPAETNAPNRMRPGGSHREGLLIGAFLRAVRQLDLTPGQKQTIKVLLGNARAQQRGVAIPIDITVLGNPGDPNYASAVQNAKALAADRVQRQSDLQTQIYAVLTSEQKARLAQVLATMKARLEQRRVA